MFKPHKLVRALAAFFSFHMTPEDLGGGGGDNGGNPTIPNLGGGGQSNPWDSVPKSWAQEHHAHWNDVKPEVRQLLHKREADFEKGINTYKPHAERYSRLHSVFKDVPEAQDPNFDPTGLFETLAQNHLAIARAKPEERRALFEQLAEAYGVSFKDVKAAAAGGGTPDIEKLVEERVNKALSPFQQHLQTQRMQETRKAIDTFFSDPKNEFATELQPDILKLVSAGEARTLEGAYQLALMRNPQVHAKYVAKLVGSAAGGQQDEKSGDRNLKSSGEGAPSGKLGSMDDTMKEIAKKHYK